MNNELIFNIKNKEDFKIVVTDLINQINESKNPGAILVLLSGDLGAGKTFFVQEFFKYIGAYVNIKSPTFILIKSYNIETNKLPNIKNIKHIDAYRLEEAEKHHLKIEEALKEEKTLIFLEWPERISLENSNYFAKISFIVNTDESRKIILQYKNPRID